MLKYICKRLLMLIPIILVVSFIVFFIVSKTPGDPAKLIAGNDASEADVAQLREELGLNDPLLLRYVRYMGNLLRGDLGTSYYTGENVFTEYIARFPATLKMAGLSIVFSTLLALPIGVLSAVKRNSIFDYSGTVLALMCVSMPTFWLGLEFIMLFALKLHWLPSGGAQLPTSIILPSLTTGCNNSGAIMRTTRSAMLDVISQDYIRTARAKGISRGKVIRKHAMKNAMVSILTIIGVQFGAVLGGAVICETVFSWPGIGRLIVDSINRRDVPMVTGCIIMTTIFVSLVNLIIDVLYACVDPRVKSELGKGGE